MPSDYSSNRTLTRYAGSRRSTQALGAKGRRSRSSSVGGLGGIMKISGSCPCGAVAFAVDGEPVIQAYCHCHSCQRAHSAPLMAVALFPVTAVNIRGRLKACP